jgi:hypothetical protein
MHARRTAVRPQDERVDRLRRLLGHREDPPVRAERHLGRPHPGSGQHAGRVGQLRERALVGDPQTLDRVGALVQGVDEPAAHVDAHGTVAHRLHVGELEAAGCDVEDRHVVAAGVDGEQVVAVGRDRDGGLAPELGRGAEAAGGDGLLVAGRAVRGARTRRRRCRPPRSSGRRRARQEPPRAPGRRSTAGRLRATTRRPRIERISRHETCLNPFRSVVPDVCRCPGSWASDRFEGVRVTSAAGRYTIPRTVSSASGTLAGVTHPIAEVTVDSRPGTRPARSRRSLCTIGARLHASRHRP